MADFPHTTVGGVSVSRLLVGTNWFFGYSHSSVAKDKFIRSYMDRPRIAEIMAVFLEAGVDAVMGPLTPLMGEAARDAEDRVGRKMHLIVTPHFNVEPGGPPETEPEPVLDQCREMGATFCFPHSSMIDALVDRLNRTIRQYDDYATMVRERGMIPGLSTHLPDSVVIADATGADVESYIQLFNAAGFIMPVEVDWAMRIIQRAAKPVMTIKPLAAGHLLPAVGLTFVWNAIREQDMVTIGTMTPDEAREVIDLSLTLLERRLPAHKLQYTRSKKGLESALS